MPPPHPHPHTQTKTFLPLESDPAIFTPLLHALGGPRSLVFTDMLSLDQTDAPPSLLALVLVFPDATPAHGALCGAEAARRSRRRSTSADAAPPVWFPQTIHNACGTYALLHAVLNGPARALVAGGETPLAGFLAGALRESAAARAAVLEGSGVLEEAHAAAAAAGGTAVPALGEDVVHHYVAFVREAGVLWELDGSRAGPVMRGCETGGGRQGGGGAEMLGERDLECVRRLLSEMEQDGGVSFGLMGLVQEEES